MTGRRGIRIVLGMAAWLLGAAAARVEGGRYEYADGMAGEQKCYQVEDSESLLEIARRFDLGYNEMQDANAAVDPFIPAAGSLVNVPTSWVLPEMQTRTGIVINIPELRLYFFPPGTGAVVTFPVGIGDAGAETPVGVYTVVEKTSHPAWFVPESIRAENPGLPKIVPPGPDNPLGSRSLRLSLRTILIHGTDKPWGVGRRSSHGCIRLYPEDIEQLFKVVPTGTRVEIVNQPIKAAARGRKIFLEVHRAGNLDYLLEAIELLADKDLIERVDFIKLRRELQQKSGVPVDITR